MMSTLPKAVAPNTKNTTPKPASDRLTRLERRLLTASSPTRMNTEVKTGLMTSATNNDELKTTMSVMGKYFMNSPIKPGQMASGMNAASVVAVEAMMGQATSPTPSFAAAMADLPSSIKR